MKIPSNAWTDRYRRRFEKPFELLPDCELSGTRWADVGCGRGVFTGALAHRLGPKAVILAMDIQFSSLTTLDQHSGQTEWGHPIHPLQADLKQALPWRNLDGVLAANVLHFLVDSEKRTALGNLSQSLTPNGTLIIVEYNNSRGTGAVPHPRSADGWLQLLESEKWIEPRICSRTSSSYLGEMIAVTATRPAQT